MKYSKEISNTINRLIELMNSTKNIYINKEKSTILSKEIYDRLIDAKKR